MMELLSTVDPVDHLYEWLLLNNKHVVDGIISSNKVSHIISIILCGTFALVFFLGAFILTIKREEDRLHVLWVAICLIFGIMLSYATVALFMAYQTIEDRKEEIVKSSINDWVKRYD